jgi:hypothetical protein
MGKAFNINYNNFMGGLNNRLAPHLLQPNEAQIALNVDLRDGKLKALNDLSSSVKTFSSTANYKWLWYAASSRWLGATDIRFALNDADKTYYTVSGQSPRVHTTSGSTLRQDHGMGIAPPTQVTWSIQFGTGKFKRGTQRYALTYETYDGLESNPQSFPLKFSFVDSDDWGITLNLFASPDNRTIKINIYRTEINQETFYYVGSVDITASPLQFVDNVSDDQLDKSRPLTWGTGGNSSNTTMAEDHGTAPPLSVLSNSLHATNDALGASGAGILFGAIGPTVRWSQLGYPEYWPEVNFFNVSEEVESIISWAGSTFIFTNNYVYAATGLVDSDISVRKTSASIGVYPGLGHLTKLTPYGVVYLSREGLALFDGSNSRVISSAKLSPDYLNPQLKTFNASSFFNNKFYLFASTETVIVDFIDSPNVFFTTTSHVVTAGVTTNFLGAVYAESLTPFPGLIDRVYVTSPGLYTSSLPTMTLTPSNSRTVKVHVEIDSVKVTVNGTTYTKIPTVTATGDCVRPAKFQAFTTGGRVTSISVIDPGEGYTTFPSITIEPPAGGGTQATVSASNVYVRITGAELAMNIINTWGLGNTDNGTSGFTFRFHPLPGQDNIHWLNVLFRPIQTLPAGGGLPARPLPARLNSISGFDAEYVSWGTTYSFITTRKPAPVGAYPNATGIGSYESVLYTIIDRPTITSIPVVNVSGTVASDGYAAAAFASVEECGYRSFALIAPNTSGNKYIYKFGGETLVQPSPGEMCVPFIHRFNSERSVWENVNANLRFLADTISTSVLPDIPDSEKTTFDSNGTKGQPVASIDNYILTPELKYDNDNSGVLRRITYINTTLIDSGSTDPKFDYATFTNTPSTDFIRNLIQFPGSLVYLNDGYTLFATSPTIDGTYDGLNSSRTCTLYVFNYEPVSPNFTIKLTSMQLHISQPVLPDAPFVGGGQSVVVTQTTNASRPLFQYEDGIIGATMIYHNNKLYFIGGKSVYGQYKNEILIYNLSNNTIERLSGNDYGFSARAYCAASLVTYSGTDYIMIHGGESESNGETLYSSDLHVFKPSATGNARWTKKFDNVMNVNERSRHSSAVIGTDLYLMGGSSLDKAFNSSVYRIPVEQLIDYGSEPGVYVAQAPSGSNISVKRFEGGIAMSTWQWRGRAEMAPDTGPILSWMRARVYGLGTLSLKVVVNNVLGGSPFTKNIASLAISTIKRFWFPSNNKSRGQTLSLDITGTSSPSSAEINKIEIEAKQDGEV